ncbi:hypothetical protein PSN45_003210 [Yamadazyma tenuis]|uniref:uncharacterized protein n=1 Tax=Candida tenuis TaxID=2315449 RepID=UPI00279D8957|nr:hypothetical protein PSN45_003210 [Yamadazyma tenuis]
MIDVSAQALAGKAQLTLRAITGNSIRSPSHICVEDNRLAYVASGGVVVCQITQDNRIQNQRFFAASSTDNDSEASSSANAYLNMISEREREPDSSHLKDSFGFSLEPDPIIFNGNNSSAGSISEEMDTISATKLKDRVRSISCMALSRNGRLLAIGETGYQPRILIFSLAPDSINSPIALIQHHTFGVSSLKFSENSRYLCSLGVVNDGVLNVWKINLNSIVLLATNRCSSVVNDLLWPGAHIITVGTRFIKVWNFNGEESPIRVDQKPTILKGKNVILGPFINHNFLSATILDECQVLIVAGSNTLVLLNLADEYKLIPLKSPPFSFNTLTSEKDSNKIWFNSNGFRINSITRGDLRPSETISVPLQQNQLLPPLSPSRYDLHTSDISRIFNYNTNYLLHVSENGVIELMNKDTFESVSLIGTLSKNIGGIKKYASEYMIFTKSGDINTTTIGDGEIRNVQRVELPSPELLQNTLTAAEKYESYLAVGDKFGHLYINEKQASNYESVYQVKAHESTINDIIMFTCEERTYLGKIYVCSSDRTISIHKIGPEIKAEKVLSLRATPISMERFANELIVSTNDKNLSIYNIDTLEQTRSLKVYNEKTNDSILLENFIVHNNIIFASTSNKCLRTFNYFTGKALTSNYGHSETVLSLSITDNKLISISADGCLFNWELEYPNNHQQGEGLKSATSSPNARSEAGLPMLSKVIRKILPSSPTRKKEDETQTPKQHPSRKASIPSLTPPHAQIILESPESSPTSRLTNATLKRIEAKRASGLAESPILRSRSMSPTSKGNGSPTKQYAVTPGKDRRTITRFSEEEAISSIHTNIRSIRSSLLNNQLDAKIKIQIRQELVSVLHLVEETSDSQLLEKYSDQLVEIVMSKLSNI